MENKKRFYARISSLTLQNFRNIEYGEIKFPNGKLDDFYNGSSSVLGLYGQNGSGKTSVIMAISVLKSALQGEIIIHEGLIKKDCETAKLIFGFAIYDNDDHKYNATYSFELFNAPEQNDDPDDELDVRSRARRLIGSTIGIKNETIEYDGVSSNGKKIRHKVLLSTLDEFCAHGTKAFGTKSNTLQDAEYNILTNNDGMTMAMLLNRRKDALKEKVSFLFHDDVVDAISKNMKNEHDYNVYRCLAVFGNFIITSSMGEVGVINFGDLPLIIFDYSDSGSSFFFGAPISLTKEFSIFDNRADSFEKQFQKINSVISKLIPGINVYLKYKGSAPHERDPQKIVRKFEFFSKRNGVEMPLRYESSGIRRLISFMSVLITAYNFPSITFAIDEFDSGIFEDLLGNLVRIFAESGRGQLIFTSHNLRPLEVLGDDNIIFTTVNCKNKFLRLSKRGNSNLRDMFLRTIKLGGTTEKLYNSPDEYEMELALALAARGESNDE